MKQTKLHPASHCPLIVLSRSDGRSSVAAAAYAARTRMTDRRTGLVHNYSGVTGLLYEGLINWNGSAEDLWNAAERSENRVNARVARELRPALPAELPLDEQRRLVHGFCCWLRDHHQIAAHWVIHSPNFFDPDEGKRLWQGRKSDAGKKAYENALYDPEVTNQNFHAHIRWTVRRVDRETGFFGEKTREFDRTNPHELSADERREGREPEAKVIGREVIKNIRSEWQRRTNAALKRVGASARIDLRSYESMIAAGDAPERMEAQEHMGPRNSAKARVAADPFDPLMPMVAVRNAAKRLRNEERWTSWNLLRQLEREKARLSGVSEEIAAEREAARKVAAEAEKSRIANARTRQEKEEAADNAAVIDLTAPSAYGYDAAIEWARRNESAGCENLRDNNRISNALQTSIGSGKSSKDALSTMIEEDEFDRQIDPETFENPDTVSAPRFPVNVSRKNRARVRTRGAE